MIPSFHRATGQESTLGASFAYSAPEHVGAHTTKPAPTAVRRAPNERDPGRDGNGGQPTGTPRALPGSSTRRQFHTLGAGTCRSPHHKTGAEKGPPDPHHETGAAQSDRRPNRRAPAQSDRRPTDRHCTRCTCTQAAALGAGPTDSAPEHAGAHITKPAPRRVRRTRSNARRRPRWRRRPTDRHCTRTPRQQHTRAPNPERDAHRPSYERPNGSSPAGRGAAGPYPTTLARSAAENSAGCSITLGAAIR